MGNKEVFTQVLKFEGNITFFISWTLQLDFQFSPLSNDYVLIKAKVTLRSILVFSARVCTKWGFTINLILI